MKKPTLKNAQGFTIIESLVYIVVVVLIAGAMVTTFLSLDDVLLRNRSERMITNDITVTFERMMKDIREAESAESDSDGNGTHNDLELTSGATTTKFYESGGKIVVDVNGAILGPLTSEEVVVDNLSFTKYMAGPTTTMIRAEIELSITNKAIATTKTYFNSAVLRGSYE